MDGKPEVPNVVRELIAAFRQRNGDARDSRGDRLHGLTAFARAMGVSVQAVQKWIKANRVPHARVRRAEEITGFPRHKIDSELYPPERESSVAA